MAALKRSLARETGKLAAKPTRKAGNDRRQRSLLLPVSGKGEKQPGQETAERVPKRRRTS